MPKQLGLQCKALSQIKTVFFVQSITSRPVTFLRNGTQSLLFLYKLTLTPLLQPTRACKSGRDDVWTVTTMAVRERSHWSRNSLHIMQNKIQDLDDSTTYAEYVSPLMRSRAKHSTSGILIVSSRDFVLSGSVKMYVMSQYKHQGAISCSL